MSNSNKTYTEKNGLKMIRCSPLNWQIKKTYVDKRKNNPKFFLITFGHMDEMWMAILKPNKMMLTLSSMSYSNNESFRFKVDSLEDASELVLKFIKGMDYLKSTKETIYWNKQN